MINERKIKSPEYADSQERMNSLWNMMVDGQEAEAVIKYADIFLKESEQNMLAKIRENKNCEEAILEYRVAFKFMEMLKHVAEIGRAKQKIFEEKRRARRSE